MEFHVFDVTGRTGQLSTARVYERHLHQLDLAEAGGFDGYWFAEHHFDPSFNVTPSPNLMLAVAAARTKRIRLGNMVNVLPYHHPIRVAEEIRMLDVLSAGRLDVGLGRGSLYAEQRGWGVAREETQERFDVSWELIRRLLTEDSVDFDLKWYSGSGIRITPEATQTPYPPMWLGAVSANSFEKAARMGMHCVFAFRTDKSAAEKLEAYREAWRRHQPGEPMGKFMVMCHVLVAETEAEACRLAKPEIDHWLEAFLKVVSDKPSATEPESYQTHGEHRQAVLGLNFEELRQQGLIVVGNPDQCVAQLRRLRDIGIDAFQGWFQFGNLDHDAADRSLQLFSDEVMPRVESRPAVATAA